MKLTTGLLLCSFGVTGNAFVGQSPLHASSSLWQPRGAYSVPLRSTARSTAAAGGRGRNARILVTCEGEIAWSKAKIVESKEVAKEQRGMIIEAGDLAKEYTVPGQFVQIKVADGKPGFYAIASPPRPKDDEGLLEFLIKETDTTKPLVEAKPGDVVEMSPVMGKGFRIKENFSGYKFDFPIQNVVLVATGTGIAPLRAAIESGALELPDEEDDGVFGRSCKLYWGNFNEESTPWDDKIKEWEAKNVEVVQVYSDPDNSWKGRTGWVQDVLKADGIRVPRNSGVLICGHPGMVEDVKTTSLAAGVLDGRVLTNF